MDDFETFKASRVKMDPSSRKMTDHQWEQSYVAYRSTRERVGLGSVSMGKVNRRRKSKSAGLSDPESSLRASQGPSTVSDLGNLRQVVRQQSAYADLRLIINILAWVVIAVFILIAVVSMFFYTFFSFSYIIFMFLCVCSRLGGSGAALGKPCWSPGHA